MTEKIFKATLDSKSTQHPEGKKTIIVIVSDKMKKDAIVKAQNELKFWDPENAELYKNPKMEELSADEGAELMSDYLLGKEQAGQMDVCDAAGGDSAATAGDVDEFDFQPSIKKIKYAVTHHDDYKNCSDPWNPEEFLNDVAANFARAYTQHGSKICADVVVGIIEDMTAIGSLCKPAFIESEIVPIALKAHANTQELAQRCSGKADGDNYVKAGPGAPDYTKSKDNFIEVSKYKLNDDNMIRFGVGHRQSKFLASFEMCLIEKDSGALAATGGDINSFADKIFSSRDNAIMYSVGMAVDHLQKMSSSLAKQLMYNDAKKLDAQIQKITSCDMVAMFDKNLSNTQLPIIDRFCDVPDMDDQDDAVDFIDSSDSDAETASKMINESGLPLHLQSAGHQVVTALMTGNYGNTLTHDKIAMIFIAGCRQSTSEDLERQIDPMNMPGSAIKFYKQFLNLYTKGDLNFNINAPTYNTGDDMHRYINKMLTNHGLEATLEQYNVMADNFESAMNKHSIKLCDGAYYSTAASEIMSICRAKGETTLIEDFMDAEDVDLLVKDAAGIYPQKEKRTAEQTKENNYLRGMMENIFEVNFNITANLSFSISCTWWGGESYVSAYSVTKDGKEITSDKCQMPTKKEALTFSLNRVKICVQDCDDYEHRLTPIDNALIDPVAWFDAYAESINENSKHHNPKAKKETKPATKPETKSEPKPEPQPIVKPETKPMQAPETKPFNGGLDELMGNVPAEVQEEKAPEISELEIAIQDMNKKLDNIEPGKTLVLDDVPNLVYHGSNGISSTKVKDACVSLMYFNAIYNTKEVEKVRGAHFDVGNLAHSLILEPELVESEYKKKPDVKEPTQPQREKYDAWTKAGKPENQSLKPSDKVIDAVEAWVAIGKPENQSLKPADAVIAKVEAHAADSENNPAPTAKQLESFDSWVNAGKPEPYKGKPTDKQIDQYCAWESAGKPEPYNGKPNDVCIERCEFWDNFTAENKDIIIVDEDNWKIAEDMAAAVMADEHANMIISHAARKSERSYFKIDDETGLLVKVRTDIDVGGVVGDVKTIQLRGNPDEEWLLSELRREIKRRKYDLSAAMYLDVTGKKDFIWIFVNKEPGYHWVATIKASAETIHEGHQKYREKLNSIKDAYDRDSWPKPVSIQKVYNEETTKFELPEI